MTLIQILLLLFILFAYSRAFLRLKEGTISLREFLFWTVVWVTGIIIVAIPTIIETISVSLGIARPVDLILTLSIALLFYLMFRIYIKINQLEEEITKIVRDVSIEKTKNEPKPNKDNR
tara:strand:- start:1889 stop:2245 length:357 start_codon:yes stop_codon:yes gene_type:complete